MTARLTIHTAETETAEAAGSVASAGRALICTANRESREQLASAVANLGLDVQLADANSREQVLSLLSDWPVDVCVVAADVDPREFLPTVHRHLEAGRRLTQLVCLRNVTADAAEAADMLSAVRCHILEPPHTAARLLAVLSSAVERGRLLAENRQLKRQLAQRGLREMVGHSAAMQTLREHVRAAADRDKPVLIRGETGTGTNLVAQAIHNSSRRAHRPLLRFDCSVLSAEGLDRELFGLKPSDSTDGAREPLLPADLFPKGCAATVDGGTIFLDNIHATALVLQKKLVQAFEAWQAPDGPRAKRMFDVRVIAATHADLPGLVRRHLFRKDLFHFLSAVSITTPTLRERRDDISLLTEHFLNQLMVKEGRPARRVSLDALELLESYDWPGNVRELQNVIDRACAIDHGPRLTAKMIEPWLAGGTTAHGDASALSLKEMERKLIETTFARCQGSRETTAQVLQIGLRTLSGKLREYGYPPRGGPGSNLRSSRKKAA